MGVIVSNSCAWCLPNIANGSHNINNHSNAQQVVPMPATQPPHPSCYVHPSAHIGHYTASITTPHQLVFPFPLPLPLPWCQLLPYQFFHHQTLAGPHLSIVSSHTTLPSTPNLITTHSSLPLLPATETHPQGSQPHLSLSSLGDPYTSKALKENCWQEYIDLAELLPEQLH